MRTTQEIFDVLDALAPQALAMDWDNCGLQVGSRNRAVNRVLIALDPFEDVCREADEIGAELIVTHHPLFFPSTSCMNEDTALGRAASMLIRGGRTLYSCHTNLDLAKGGVNDRLAQVLGLQNVEPISAEGLLRRGTVAPQPLGQFLATVKATLEDVINNDNWAAYAGQIATLGLVSGDDPSENFVQLPVESTQWSDDFTEADYVALVGELFSGARTVSNDITAEPTTTVAVDYQGNIK